MVDWFLREIVAEMVLQFGSREDQAIDRVGQGLGRVDLSDGRFETVLREKTPADWAPVFQSSWPASWWGPGELLPGPRTGMAEGQLRAIVADLIRLFRVGEAEALGRVARAFEHIDLTDEQMVFLICHDEPEYWAKKAYYGPSVLWWTVDEATLEPEPWP